ncbi:MAG: aminotransferase, partial [Phycisphaerales bacterium]
SRFRLEFDYTGTADVTPFLVLPELISFMETIVPRRADDGPWAWASLMRFNRENTLRGRDILCRELGAAAPAPDEMIAALASVPIRERGPGEPAEPTMYHDPLQDRLIRRWGIQAPIVLYPPGVPGARTRLVRIAMQAYNTVQQVEYLAQALKSELA